MMAPRRDSAQEQAPHDRMPLSRPHPSTRPITVWIDLDNTPHVPFFAPMIRELRRLGYRVVLTARDAFQVCEVADRHRLSYVRVGRHYGRNVVKKVVGVLWRSLQLLPFCLRYRPDIAVSHGARAQTLLSNLLGIPTIGLLDYEHVRMPLLLHPRWLITPDAIAHDGLSAASRRIRTYRGIKEDVYVPDFEPDPAFPRELGLREAHVVITVRPPATEAHYHNPEAEVFLNRLMDRIVRTPGARAVLLPRNHRQEEALRNAHARWFLDGAAIVPGHAVDGLNLLWFSDLVVSGGGTMNREAAALGVPVYSIFRGPLGAVDRMLEQEGRLVILRSVEDVDKIVLARRDKTGAPIDRPRAALRDIVGHVEEIVRIELSLARREDDDR
jgi:predicted glycosyltransferase